MRSGTSSSGSTVTTVLKQASHGQCKAETIRSLRATAATSLGLTVASAERSQELRDLLARWALLDAQVLAVEAQIAVAVAACPEATLLTSVPEISAPCAAMLVGELGHPSSFDSPRQWLKLAGLNGVTAESGLSAGVLRLIFGIAFGVALVTLVPAWFVLSRRARR